MIKNHYGIIIDTNQPITGVISNNNVEFLNDEIISYRAIDLDYENFLKTKPSRKEIESYESDNSTYLIGDWIKRKGKYQPKKSGEYAAIVNETTTQVVFSKTTKLCNLCSPCYPGQGDLDSDGIWLTYDLPSDLKGNNHV